MKARLNPGYVSVLPCPPHAIAEDSKSAVYRRPAQLCEYPAPVQIRRMDPPPRHDETRETDTEAASRR